MGATDPTPESVEKKDVEVKAEETVAKPVEEVEDVPDPDEDDLDDLDDMLDDFSAVKLDQSKAGKTETPAATSAPAATAATATSDAPKAAAQASGEPGPDVSEEEFAKQLQAGMADLLGELEKSPQMQQEFEDMFKQFTAAGEGAEAGVASGAGAAAGASKAAADAGADATFQDTIRRTMERMQNSGEQATAAAASGGADDFMSELLKQMSAGGGDLGGEGGEEEFSKMLMGMMEQLTNKDILYEPMKELNDKFPEWMEKNKATTSAEDLKRYEEQQVLVKEIVDKFESSTYADSNAADREYIVERMQKMQEAGSPPSDLVGDMASAQEAFGGGGDGADEQCNPQ